MLSAVIPSITIQNAMGFFAHTSASFHASNCGFELNYVLNDVMLSAVMPRIMIQNAMEFFAQTYTGFQVSNCDFKLS
jgi:hypothetical protein